MVSLNEIGQCLRKHWVGGVIGMVYAYTLLHIPSNIVFSSGIMDIISAPFLFFIKLLGRDISWNFTIPIFYIIGAATQWILFDKLKLGR